MNVLELIDVNKDYKLANKEKFRALHNVNVSFEKGELVSIIGESGSGKSTLMNLIGGLDSDYEGIINIDGKNLKSFKEKQLDDYRKKKIGFVFQSFNLIPHLSVLDNVTIGLTLSNVKESEKVKKATVLLEKLGLEKQIKKKPTQLSGGQKQRVAIARALINDPDIILADEPTGALDSSTTEQILRILKEIADDGKLVIMVTHSEKVASISSRVVEIADGKIVRDQRNENYQKIDVENKLVVAQTEVEHKKKEGHLSFWSAFKLSVHNMWAGKTKNILMAVGVSISLVAMILMLSFGSGLTGYISDTAQDYSNPNVVTISKADKDNQYFSDEEILALQEDINSYLSENDNDFEIRYQGDGSNLSKGYSMITLTAGTLDYTKEDEQTVQERIMFTYTTPPYYDQTNLVTQNGHISGEKEIMVSEAICKTLGVENPEEAVGKEVTLKISYGGISIEEKVTISAIVDVSMFSGMVVMYVDYNYFNNCVVAAQTNAGLDVTGITPNMLYLQTDDENTTNIIKEYISAHSDTLSGSVEEQLSAMFSQMMSTFSIALAVISGISLFVALIMILVVLYMSVSERTKEIGVLKSIGARKKDIRLIFSTESFLIGLFSGLVGITLSLVCGGILTIIFNALLGFAPIRMEIQYFAIALLISIVISVLAGLYPSSKAAKLDPVESLRRE
ncbi:MAG: ATP-binding cassette domain-containing protein [Clostridia bacterium]|nr:ATP-binding cassette domain-containing protein [Clostridia bacterium]